MCDKTSLTCMAPRAPHVSPTRTNLKTEREKVCGSSRGHLLRDFTVSSLHSLYVSRVY